MAQAALDFSLPNVGPGRDPLPFRTVAADNDFVVLFLQRDHYCTNCRNQVQDIAAHYDAFRERNAEVISIVPEPKDRVASWQAAYDLPFPILADPDASVGDQLDQPVRFGVLGNLSDFFGRMPSVIIVDCRGSPEIVWTHRGRSTFDRPSIDEILSQFDSRA